MLGNSRLYWQQFRPDRAILNLIVPPKKSHAVIANSIPKSGTNLLLRSLYLMPRMRRKFMRTISGDSAERTARLIRRVHRGEFAAAHVKYSSEVAEAARTSGIKNILMVRDLRDIAVSNFIYITYKDPGHRLHKYYTTKIHTDADRLMATLVGIGGADLGGEEPALGLAEHVADFTAWGECKDCLVIRFEDLVGVRGGGTVERQLRCLAQIRTHLEADFDDATLEQIAGSLFDENSRTFNKGQVGAWRQHFQPAHLDYYAKYLEPLAATIGY